MSAPPQSGSAPIRSMREFYDRYLPEAAKERHCARCGRLQHGSKLGPLGNEVWVCRDRFDCERHRRYGNVPAAGDQAEPLAGGANKQEQS